MRPQDLERERACFDVLRQLPRRGVVLIGGYAISVHGPPRFSVDLDLVLAPSVLDTICAILGRQGFVREKQWEGSGVFARRSERWTRDIRGFPVSADLLIGGVFDRTSGAKYSYRELRSRAAPQRVHGLDPASEAEALVVDRETLVALKLEVGRLVDLRDVAVLAAEHVEEGAIVSLLKRAPPQVVRAHLDQLMTALDTVEFRNSLKGVYMLDDRAFERIAAGARRLALGLLNRMKAHDRLGTPGDSR